ncbi:MAG: WXG100 family type VII secretion target [Acidimicrobiaceae bacterium]|nr:WXG100 family type VII secretion target [Acidimicrobiaceae bacterium]
MSMIGGNIPELGSLSNSLEKCSSDVTDILTQLNADLGNTWWVGGAADRFRADWESEYQPALRSLSQALTDASTEVNRRLTALEEVGG